MGNDDIYGRTRTKKSAPSTIRFRSCLRNTIVDVARERGWVETDSDSDWDFCWADKRSNLNSSDVLAALDDMEFAQFKPTLEACIEAHRAKVEAKKARQQGVAEDTVTDGDIVAAAGQAGAQQTNESDDEMLNDDYEEHDDSADEVTSADEQGGGEDTPVSDAVQ